MLGDTFAGFIILMAGLVLCDYFSLVPRKLCSFGFDVVVTFFNF